MNNINSIYLLIKFLFNFLLDLLKYIRIFEDIVYYILLYL